MPLYENCIHWRVCALACPLDVKECRHFKAEGDEVKHAHWADRVNEMECSDCNTLWNYCDNDTHRFNYCPNCGAIMDESEVQI